MHIIFCLDINECDLVNGPSGRCGQNAICTNSPGGFSCHCKPGYSGNAFKQCIGKRNELFKKYLLWDSSTIFYTTTCLILDINECDRSVTCGHGAICLNTEGSYSCSCPEETIPDPDPYTKCVGIVTCDTDSDCPGNSICDSQKRCLCPEPNVGNDCRRKIFFQNLSLYKITIYKWINIL